MFNHVWSLNYSSAVSRWGSALEWVGRANVTSHSPHSLLTINRHLWLTTMTLNIFYKATNSSPDPSPAFVLARPTHAKFINFKVLTFCQKQNQHLQVMPFRAGLSVGHVFIWHQFGSSYQINYLGHDYCNFCRSLPHPDVPRYILSGSRWVWDCTRI